MKTRILSLITLLTVPASASAQMELSANLELGYPFLTNQYNKNLLYNQLSPGVRFGFSYKPENTQFFPTLHYAFGRTKMPLKQFGRNVAFLEQNYQNLMLSANLLFRFYDYSQLYVYTGIGLVSLKNKGIDVSGREGSQIRARIDSAANIDKRFPAVNLGFEYVVAAAEEHNFYISAGINVQGWYFATNRNNYFLDITDASGNTILAESALTGLAIVPYFYMSLHCKINRELFRK
jgi:hypothetical protein